MKIIRFCTRMKRNTIISSVNERYVIGIIQGLLYGLCTIPCNTVMWDCEVFNNEVLFAVDCTKEQYKKFIEAVELIYPGLCKFQEV